MGKQIREKQKKKRSPCTQLHLLENEKKNIEILQIKFESNRLERRTGVAKDKDHGLG